jgi:hypothetical protein
MAETATMFEINLEGQPKVSTKTFTVRDIYEALAKNGLQHLRGSWYSTNAKGETVGACVLGQAAFNLNAPATSDENSGENLIEFLNSLPIDSDNKWGTMFDGFNTHTFDNVGEAIIAWNDSYRMKSDGTVDRNEKGNPKWLLRTYPRVVEMAYGLLEPHFDKTVELPHYEYS